MIYIQKGVVTSHITRNIPLSSLLKKHWKKLITEFGDFLLDFGYLGGSAISDGFLRPGFSTFLGLLTHSGNGKVNLDFFNYHKVFKTSNSY